NVLLGYRAFGAWPMVGGIAAVLPIAMLVGMIPITLGNLGIAEGAYVVYFGLVGMGKELTLAMGLLLRLKIIMLGLVGMVAQMTLPAGTLPHEPESPDPEAAQTDSPPGNVHS
ncbi:MAG: hypothetical protein RBT03_06465, partial [Kiritimatiellia bacterium]|nr:hypothetical protein [Kiritimatiellia bacterium]